MGFKLKFALRDLVYFHLVNKKEKFVTKVCKTKCVTIEQVA
jgi:hypothetical protein